MVYINEIVRRTKEKLLLDKNIELVAYLSITSPEELENHDFELTPDEEIALKGYRKQIVESSKVDAIVSKPSVKGMDATSNIYKFAGLYLAAKDALKTNFEKKYSEVGLMQKYFLSKIEPSFTEVLRKEVESLNTESISVLIRRVLGFEVEVSKLESALYEISRNEIDIQILLLLEDIEKVLLKVKYINKNSEEIIRGTLNNFTNAIQKIIKDRRKDHTNFIISDEYDVQDILYVILKSIFPALRDEDPIPKVGAKSTKIDLILRDDKILIEVKMIKEKDTNETHFIEELKVDFESYHECQWLDKLFCFVYDPYKKTRDISNFQDMNGNRTKGEHSFNVEVIVVH